MIYSSHDKTTSAASLVFYHSSEDNSCGCKSLGQEEYDCTNQTDTTVTTHRTAFDQMTNVFILYCIVFCSTGFLIVLLNIIIIA